MTNFVKDGDIVTVTAPYAVASGEGCLVGNLFGVATYTAAVSTEVEIATEGIFNLKKTANLAVSSGDALYWDDTNKELTKTSTNVPVGVCTKTAVTASSVVRVKLPGYIVAIDSALIRQATVTISAADIVATTAGKFGHAAGFPLVADPGAGKVVELISAVVYYKYDTAGYGVGGNTTININGGAALTGVVANSALCAATADKVNQFVPLSTAGNALTVNKGLNLVTASAFTQPGTAAGTLKVFVNYRVLTLA